MLVIRFPYHELKVPDQLPSVFVIGDHLGGFDHDLNNQLLADLDKSDRCFTILTDQIYPDEIHKKYPRLEIKFDLETFLKYNQINEFHDYNVHPDKSFLNLLCSFNGSDHVSRKLLVAALHQWRYFDPDTCSKNFRFTVDKLDGHLGDYLEPDQHRFHRPFFIGADSERFFDEIYSFGHVRFDHASNIRNLERQLTRSFLHVVSETMATSYYPFVTEKFLYSVVTRGLFLAYAQPGWHEHLARHYGFRRYDRIFDYRFDAIPNPVERLVELMSMISKFSVLDTDDWHDLYEIEIDTIEYNYDWYFGKKYLEYLKENESSNT